MYPSILLCKAKLYNYIKYRRTHGKQKSFTYGTHFGTTHDDTRELTINKMNKKFSKKFTDYDFYEAYTSRIILKKLKDRDF